MTKKRVGVLSGLMAAAVTLAGCASGGETPSEPDGGGEVTLEFSQWWDPELPDGALRGIMDDFEAANPGIKVELLSGPYASTKEQVIAGAASGTMSDVVGLDGAWVNDFAKQGSLADMSVLMKNSSFDESELVDQVKVDDKTYMIPTANFVYPLFVNNALMKEAGVAEIPSTRTEFAEAAKKITDLGGDRSGWALPLSLEAPNGVQNDVMSWVWASGGSMMSDGKPDLENADVKDAMVFIKDLYDAGVVAPGAFTMKEQDKVEEFTNGRVGMMIDSLAHVTLIKETNANLDFSVAAIPAKEGYTGKRGIPYASWGIGIAENSEHQAEAWKLVSYLLSADVNTKLANAANAFPGNTKSVPTWVDADENFKAAFKIYQDGVAVNEFVGLPVAEELMRSFSEELQKALDGDQSIDEALAKAQEAWMKNF